MLFECEVKTLIYWGFRPALWSAGPASIGLATIAVISPGPGRLSRAHFPELLDLRSPAKGDFRAYFPRPSQTG